MAPDRTDRDRREIEEKRQIVEREVNSVKIEYKWQKDQVTKSAIVPCRTRYALTIIVRARPRQHMPMVVGRLLREWSCSRAGA